MSSEKNNQSAKISNEFEEAKEEIWDLISRLEIRWVIYCQIFRQGPRTTELLNEVAAGFFGNTQSIWLDHIVQDICKLLLDRAKFRDRRNLSLKYLFSLVGETKFPDLSDELTRILEAGNNVATRLRDQRNRRIAHYDYETHQENDGTLGYNAQEIQTSLRLIAEFRAIVEKHLYANHYLPEPPGGVTAGNAIVKACKFAKAFEEERKDETDGLLKLVDIGRSLDDPGDRFDPYEIQPLPWEDDYEEQ